MEVKLISSTNNPEYVITMAASLCYSDKEFFSLNESSLDKTRQETLIKNLIDSGHDSPLEHASFTFYINEVSRVLSHQLVRHRIASFSQRSQRYTSQKSEYVIPDSLLNNEELKSFYIENLNKIYDDYNKLIKNVGLPKEDARFILPNASVTSLIMTMNLRELRHFFSLRLCHRAQWEIRKLAINMYKIILKEHPILLYKSGPACVHFKCTEKHKTLTCPFSMKEIEDANI